MKGWELFIKKKVSIDFESDDLLIFKVQGSTEYMVSVLDEAIRCDCDDFYNRWQRDYGIFLCKHIWATIFYLIFYFTFLKHIKYR
jgi:hypothetical protein